MRVDAVGHGEPGAYPPDVPAEGGWRDREGPNTHPYEERENHIAARSDRVLNLVPLAQLKGTTNRFRHGRLIAIGECRFDVEVGGHGALRFRELLRMVMQIHYFVNAIALLLNPSAIQPISLTPPTIRYTFTKMYIQGKHHASIQMGQ